MAIYSTFVAIGSLFLTDEIRLPDPKGYQVVDDRDEEDIIEEEIEDEEDRLRRQEEDGTIDITSPNPNGKPRRGGHNKLQDDDDSVGSSDDEIVDGVSRHLLSREH